MNHSRTRLGWGLGTIVALCWSSVAQAQEQPRVAVQFEGCPSTYAPLVARFVEIELGLSLLGANASSPDFRAGVTCEGTAIQVDVKGTQTDPEAKSWDPIRFDLAKERASDRPRIIGLKLAYLLEEVTSTWLPPIEELPPPDVTPESSPLPPPLPPPPPEAPAPEEDGATTDSSTTATERTIGEQETAMGVGQSWSVWARLGASVLGKSSLWGTHTSLGARWSLAEIPLALSLDLSLLSGNSSASLGDVKAWAVAPAAFVDYRLALTDGWSLRAGAGYRAGWVRLAGEGNGTIQSDTLSALWHGPAARLGAEMAWGRFAVGVEVEAGYAPRNIVGIVDSERVRLQGLWISTGLTAALLL